MQYKTMQYKLATKFDESFIKENSMGPNPAKLLEESLAHYPLEAGSIVLDLGCGRGITSIMLAKEYGLRVFATDLWIPATENFQRFTAARLTREQIVPIHADAHEMPYADEFFDAVVSIDSYQYFGLEPDYLGKHLLPLVKHGGKLILLVPGFRKDVHDNFPPELLLSWTPEALDTIHDCAHWRSVISATEGIEILAIQELEREHFDECWREWLETDNEYAVGDRASMNAGAGNWMNFVLIALKKR